MSKSRRKKKAPPEKKRRGCLHRIFWAFFKMGIVCVMLWAVVALGYYSWALTFDLRTITDMPQRSMVLDKEGHFYSRLEGENRIIVPFDKVSPNFVHALLAREDTRFYYHHGIDPLGILRAIFRNFLGGSFHRQGASTITQQLARNSFPLGGKNLHRKLIEAALAYRIETELTKEQILQDYMNRIYFGSGYYGVETASQAYFGKPAAKMNLSEAATLAGLIRGPNLFSPFNNPQGALTQRDTVLQRMRQLNYINDKELQQALAAPLDTVEKRPTPQQNWAMDTILRELQLVIDQDQLDGGGLKIYTTIDADLQRTAEASVQKRLTQIESSPGYHHTPFKAVPDNAAGTPYLEAAAIVLDNKDGGIRAIVGGRDFDRSKFNRALLGRRQIGSAIKPFVYAKAFQAGLKPDDLIDDGRLRRGELPAKYGVYDPANSDNTYGGLRPAADGLIFSRNTMSIRIGMHAGLDSIADTIIRAGIATQPPRFPSLCLGAFESSLKDLTAAYTIFATGGTKLQPYLIEKIVDTDGHVLFRATHGRLDVLPPGPAHTTRGILEQVLTRGTAARADQYGLTKSAAGKTGTTNDYQDAWFLGFDSALTCGVWVGFDLPTKIMAGGTGGELALPIWVDIIQAGTD